jgi:type IV pilus assembly protein PilA
MQCPNCRYDNPPQAAFCNGCGAALQAERYAPAAPRRGLAIASLVLGILSLPTVGLLFVGAALAITLGIIAIYKANSSPEEYGGKGLAIGGIVSAALSLLLIPFIGIIAAIAIPSLLRARISANEASAIGDIRTVISAEAAYSSANGGRYDMLECLGTPHRCIPNYSGPTFLDPQLASGGIKNGYQRKFYPGPPAPPPADGSVVSPSSCESFAYVAVPVQPNRTGVRGFCGDASGVIFMTVDGSAPRVVNGMCDSSATALR